MAVSDQSDWKKIIMAKPSGGSSRNSYRFKKAKRKIRIGGNPRPALRRISRRATPLADPPIVQIDVINGPEPNDKFNKGLWSCTSEEMVQAQFNKWWKAFNRKARRSIKRRKVPPELKSTLEALLDRPGATSTPLLNSQLICNVAYKFVHVQLVALAAADPEMEVGFVTFICGSGATSHNRPVIELFHSHAKVQRTLRAMSDNFFGITELVLFNSHTHADGGQLVQRHEHALIWGKNILARASLIAAKHASHFTPNFTDAPIIDVKKVAINEVNLARMSAYLFKPPYKCMTWCPPRDGKDGHMHGSPKADRYIRYLRMLQLRSMMSVEDVTFGGGQGSDIRSDMRKFLRALAVKEGTAITRAIHPDAVPSFWVDLAKAIDASSWALPIIKTRK